MKYELTDETNGSGLRRIRALRDIPRYGVNEGDLGGWVESEGNLTQEGDCWVFGKARVFGKAQVCDTALIYGDARVCGNARVFDAAVCGGVTS